MSVKQSAWERARHRWFGNQIVRGIDGFIELPEGSGAILDMAVAQWNGHEVVIVLTSKGGAFYLDDGKFSPIDGSWELA